MSLHYFKRAELNEQEYPLLTKLMKDYINLLFPEPDISHIDTTGSVYNVPQYSQLKN